MVPGSAVVKIAAFLCERAWDRHSFSIWTGCFLARSGLATRNSNYHLNNYWNTGPIWMGCDNMVNSCNSFAGRGDWITYSAQVLRSRRRAPDCLRADGGAPRVRASLACPLRPKASFKPALHIAGYLRDSSKYVAKVYLYATKHETKHITSSDYTANSPKSS